MRRTLLAAASLACLSAVPVAGLRAQAPTQTLHIALRQDADALDPTLGRTLVGRNVFASLCDKLFDINDKIEIVPQLALGYEWTDPKTLVIKLRPNVLFHDGTKLDAEAVKYSLNRHLTMQGSFRRGEVATMDHIDVVDPLTVRIVLKSPTSPFLAVLTDRAGMIVSPKAAEAAGKDFALHPVCAGPFKFVERVAQDRIVLDRFPEYWNAPAIHFARVVYLPIVDPTTRIANLRAGAVEMAEYIAPSDTGTVKSDPKLRLIVAPGLGYAGVDLNLGHGPQAAVLADKRIREALELSIDRDAINQVVWNGMFTPTAQALPPGSPYYVNSVKPPVRDVAKAKALLAAAGVKTPYPITFTVENSATDTQLGEVIQSMAGEAGFDIKLKQTEFSTALDAADRGEFEMFSEGWSGRADPDGNLWNFLHTGAPLNVVGYSDKEVDGWLDEARASTDPAARKALYAKVVAKVADDLPLLYLFATPVIQAVSAKISGYTPVPDGLIRVTNLTMQP